MPDTIASGAPRALLLLAIALVGGCGEGGTGATPGGGGGGGGAGDGSGAPLEPSGAACELAPMREWVEASLLDYYLFADRVQRVRLTDYGSDSAVLEALRVDPPDRYSYLGDEREYDAYFEEGRTFGFGWRFVRTDADTLLFSHVAPGSPVDRAGVKRGDRLLAIDGVALADFLALPEEERDRRLGLPGTPVTLALTLEGADGARRTVSVRSEEHAVVTVADSDIVEHAGARVGYLHLTGFLETSNAELDASLDAFAAAGVDELVLDLRHNGGGRVDVAAELAGALGGDAVAGETFARFRHNDRYALFDVDIDFGDALAPLDLARVLVLTSADTCSASELVINALTAPFIEVVTIGEATCGKPFGTSPERRCGRVLNALEVRFANAAGGGDYVDGLPADCPVADDPRSVQGRPGDPLYDRALAFVAGRGCDVLAGRAQRPPAPRPVPERPFARPPLHGGAVLP